MVHSQRNECSQLAGHGERWLYYCKVGLPKRSCAQENSEGSADGLSGEGIRVQMSYCKSLNPLTIFRFFGAVTRAIGLGQLSMEDDPESPLGLSQSNNLIFYISRKHSLATRLDDVPASLSEI